MIRQAIGTALGLSIYAVLFLLLANSPAVQEPSRGNEWGQLNTFNPCTSIHALDLMASLLNAQCASRATVSITWHGHHLHVSHANQMLVSMTG